MATCMHGADPKERVAACSGIIGSTDEHRTLIRALNARGNALCDIEDRCGQAVPDFAAIVKMAPTIAGYFDNYARALRAARRYDEAIAASERAVRLAPRLAFTYAGKAHTQEEAGRIDGALATVSLALEALPTDAGLWEHKGKLLGELKRFAEAYPAFERALVLQPDRSGIYIERAGAELAEGRYDAAIADLARYPADGEDADEVRGKLQVLKTLSYNKAKEAGEAKTITTQPVVTAAVVPQGETDHRRTPAPSGTSATPSTCNFYDWTPVARCLWEYHTENDPMPTGAPNSRHWNAKLATEGKIFATKHLSIPWDHPEWSALASNNSKEFKPPEPAKLQYHAQANLAVKSDIRGFSLGDSKEAVIARAKNELEAECLKSSDDYYVCNFLGPRGNSCGDSKYTFIFYFTVAAPIVLKVISYEFPTDHSRSQLIDEFQLPTVGDLLFPRRE